MIGKLEDSYKKDGGIAVKKDGAGVKTTSGLKKNNTEEDAPDLAAKKLLEVGRKTVTEAMYEVGYSDAGAFRRVFKEVTSLSPVEYRNRYNKEAVG